LATTTVRNLGLRIPFAAGVCANNANPFGIRLRTIAIASNLRDRPDGRCHKGVKREKEH
jgi:hypothetical protein